MSSDAPCIQGERASGTPRLRFEFRPSDSQGYQGEHVVPFDGQRRAPWEMLELRRAQPPTKASGWWKGLLMQDRKDAQRARSRRVEHVPEPTDPHHEPSERLLEAWAPVEDELRAAVGPSTFAIWLADLHPHRFVGGVWILAHRKTQAQDWIEHRFGRLLADVAGAPVRVVVCGCETFAERAA